MANSIIIDGKPVGRIKAGWMLFKESYGFFRADKEMLWIPVITSCISIGLTVILCLVAFFVGFHGSIDALKNTTGSAPHMGYLFLFFMYVIGAFTLALSEAGIAHIVYTRIKGGDATLAQGLQSAFSHWFSLLLWSAITSTVGVILQMIADRSKILMSIVVALMGAAWSALTYFVVPTMVIDNKSAFASIPHSALVFKKTWGETLVSNASLGIVFLLFDVLALLVGGLLIVVAVSISAFWLVGLIIALLIFVLFIGALLQSTLSGVIKTLLYVYASEGTIPPTFNQQLLGQLLAGNQNTASGSTNTEQEVVQN